MDDLAKVGFIIRHDALMIVAGTAIAWLDCFGGIRYPRNSFFRREEIDPHSKGESAHRRNALRSPGPLLESPLPRHNRFR